MKAAIIWLIIFCSCALLGCDNTIKTEQKVSTIEVGTENIPWEDFVVIDDAEKYHITYDASDVDVNTLGKYTVTYAFENKENKKVVHKNFSFKVEDTTVPEIRVHEEKNTLLIGEEVTPLDLVDIVDNYDGELAEENIKVKSDLDTTKEGVYTIEYIAMDSSKNQAVKEIEVTVVKDRAQKINIGDTITLDFVEMSVLNTDWSSTIKPKDTSSVYSYMSDQDGETYFWISGNIKNTSGEKYDIENIEAEIIFDNRYTYSAYLIATDGYSFYDNYVNPLKTVKYYIYASVPDEVREMYSTCQIKFGFTDNFAEDYLRLNFEKCDYIYAVELTN